MTTEEFIKKLEGVKRTSNGWEARCPAHDDNKASLCIATGDDGRVLLTCQAGCSTKSVVAAMGLSMGDLFPEERRSRQKRRVCAHVYTDADGNPIQRKWRYVPKSFSWEHLASGKWVPGRGDGPPVLYNLAALSKSDPNAPVLVVDGEKDVDTAETLGFLATCSPDGNTKGNVVKKWRPAYTARLAGHPLLIIPDNDSDGTGRTFSEHVARECHSTAPWIKIGEMPKGKDLTAFIELGGTVEELQALFDAAPFFVLPTTLNPNNPMGIARKFVEIQPPLIRYAGELYRYDRGHYVVYDEDELRAGLYAFLDAASTPHGSGFFPNKSKVANVLDALVAVVPPSPSKPTCWLARGSGDPDAITLVPCANGLLNVATGTLLPLTPRLFCTHGLGIPYGEHPTVLAEWLAFLHELWPDDPEAIIALQDWFGYVIGGDTRLHKIFMIVGPKRSGKGTIARVLRCILGEHNVAAPTLAGLQTNFGLQCLIDKPLAIIGDARLSGRADQAAVVERLLTISGEDCVTVDRKHRDPITLQLPTRFMLLTNELPRLHDPSGAMASRFVVLTLERSWLGREDVELFERLKLELPGILQWAMEGWRRVRASQRLTEPVSSRDTMAELEELGSPITAFVNERCVVGPAAGVACDELYRAWREWSQKHGRDLVGTAQSFGRDLRAALPAVRMTQPRVGGVQIRHYEGVALKTA